MTRQAIRIGGMAAVGLAAAAAHAGPTLELVMKNTQTVPGIAGVSWATGTSQFQGSSIDSSGNVGFRGTLLTGTGGVTSSNNATMWYGAPGTLNLVGRTGFQAPGLAAGVNMTGLQSQQLPLSPNGNMWFGGTTTAPSGYLATGTYGALSSVARNGDTLPGVSLPLNLNPGSTSNYSNVNNAGQTLVFGQLSDNSGALWVGGPGSLQFVLRTGQSYAGLPSSTTVQSTETASMINGSGNLMTGVLMNQNPGAGITDHNNEVVTTRAYGGSSFNVLARETDPAPGFGAGYAYGSGLYDAGLGLEFNEFNFGNGNYNNAGHAVFSGAVTGPGLSAGVNDGGVFYHNGTSTNLFHRDGDATSAIPGAAVHVTAGDATGMRLNNNDQLAWVANLTVGTGGVTSANNAALVQTALGSGIDTLIARKGMNVPVTPGALFGTFTNLMQNNAGQIVFSTTLTDDPNDPNNNVTTANDLALYAFDPVLGLMQVAREGDSLAAIGINMTLTGSWLTMFTTANAEGGANALSDNGWLTFRVTGTALAGFTDTAAIVRTQLPSPGTSALLAGGLLALLRRRRA